jgi:hypothetical protein
VILGEGNVYLYRVAVDMRKSINGLCAIVVEEMEDNPGNGVLCPDQPKRTLGGLNPYKIRA